MSVIEFLAFEYPKICLGTNFRIEFVSVVINTINLMVAFDDNIPFDM